MSVKGKTLSPEELWQTLKEAEIEDELEEIVAMSDAELGRYLTANGGDPAKLRPAGGAHAEELFERRARLGGAVGASKTKEKRE